MTTSQLKPAKVRKSGGGTTYSFRSHWYRISSRSHDSGPSVGQGGLAHGNVPCASSGDTRHRICCSWRFDSPSARVRALHDRKIDLNVGVQKRSFSANRSRFEAVVLMLVALRGIICPEHCRTQLNQACVNNSAREFCLIKIFAR